jgi:hypothetical protein
VPNPNKPERQFLLKNSNEKKFCEISFLLLSSIIIVSCDSEKDDPEIFTHSPNVIYIYADDFGYGELGSYVNKLPSAPWEIYNLENDPSESRNIASEHAGLINKPDQIVTKEHISAHLREWEFVGRNFSTNPL